MHHKHNNLYLFVGRKKKGRQEMNAECIIIISIYIEVVLPPSAVKKEEKS